MLLIAPLKVQEAPWEMDRKNRRAQEGWNVAEQCLTLPGRCTLELPVAVIKCTRLSPSAPCQGREEGP